MHYFWSAFYLHLKLSHVYSQFLDNRRLRKSIICLIKTFLSNWTPSTSHSQDKQTNPHEVSNLLITQVYTRFIDGLGTTSLEVGTIRILRPITLSISALLLSKTSVWEPRNWYYNHSLMSNNLSRKPRVILRQHRARLLQSDVSYVCTGYICLHAPGLMLMDIWENYLETLKSYVNVGFILDKNIYWLPKHASKKVIKENDADDNYDDSFWCVWNVQGKVLWALHMLSSLIFLRNSWSRSY